MAASSSMPPPSTLFAHRRSSRLITPPHSPESSPCLRLNMSLTKGNTFHPSCLPPVDEDPVLSIRHLARRSPTCSQSTLASWLSEKKDIAQSLVDFDQTFSGARGKRQSNRRRSAQEFEQQLNQLRASLDEGLGSSIASPSEKGLTSTFERALDWGSDKDSGLGTSISGTVKHTTRGGVPATSEDDGLAKDLIQEANIETTPQAVIRQQGAPNSATRASALNKRSAVTQSIAPLPNRTPAHHSPLSSFARKKLARHIYGPILRETRFEDFHPLVTSLASKSNKAIRCLRDLEQSLLFQPLTLSISRHLYRAFGEFSIQLVVDTYQHLSESDQRRAADRPYDSGYFLDLVQQVGLLASQINESNQSEDEDDADMIYSADDEVTLEGGLGESGNIAELVRWKNGKGTSLRTGQPYTPLPSVKREASGALDEDAERSMARRKKGYIPEIVEMECSDPTCKKIFTRKCDLAKHEKTHSRPFKCPMSTCKYHEQGLPTEKERDRHVNDKHDPNPQYYKCDFCEFRTKRESNCKQHQEKKHGWHYERAKGKDKVVTRATPSATPQTPAMEYTPSTKSPAVSHHTTWDDTSSISGSIAGSVQLTPFEQSMPAFDFNQPMTTNYSAPLFPRQTAPVPQYTHATDLYGFNGNYDNMYGQAYISPAQTAPMSPPVMGTPITPAYSNITGQSPFVQNVDLMMGCGDGMNWNTGMPTPNSFLQPPSRHASMSHESPIQAGPSDFMFTSDPLLGQDFDNLSADFPLFGTENSHAFSNPAAASATLFPGPDKFAALDNYPMDDINWDDDGMMM